MKRMMDVDAFGDVLGGENLQTEDPLHLDRDRGLYYSANAVIDIIRVLKELEACDHKVLMC